MKLIITVSNKDLNFILYDTVTESLVPFKGSKYNDSYSVDDSRPKHLPYGITWNKDNVFIANRKNLIIYDNELNIVDVKRNILDQSTHQILWHNDKIISTMTNKDSLGFFDLKTCEKELYHPAEGWGVDFPETHKCFMFRINGLTAKKNLLYYLLFNFNNWQKQIHILDLESRLPCPPITLNNSNTKCHGVFIHSEAEKIMTLNGIGELEDECGVRLVSKAISARATGQKSYVFRGMAGSDVDWCCAFFKARYTGSGAYINTHRNGKLLSTKLLVGVGSVYDMRRIDGPDFCHNNPYDFPYKHF